MKSPASAASKSQPWIATPGAKIIVSLILVLHLTAIFVAPFDVALFNVEPPMTAKQRTDQRLISWLADFFGPYLDAAYINHGYHFFAPDPGWASLVHYEGERKDGTPLEGTLPDINEHWPRLRYHRHFMLAENRFGGLQPDLEVAYAKHLLNVHDAKWVRLDAVTHFLARPDEILAGVKLDDPKSYEIREIVTVTAEGDVTFAVQEENSEPPGEQP